jgi:hypothetical protein
MERERAGRPTVSVPPALATGLGLAILSVLLVASLWIIPYLPTNDGPESILAVHIENHFGDPGTIYSQVFEPTPQFAGRGFTVLFEPLEEVLGWQRGLQVALSVLVLVPAWGFVALVRAVDRRRLPIAFLGFPLALSWSLYMGFFAFVLSSGVGLFIVAASLARPTAARRALLAALLLLQAFLHMFPAILTGLVVALVLVVNAPREERLRECGRVALIGLPAAGLTLAAFLIARGTASTVAFAANFLFVSLPVALASWPRTLAPGPLGRALVVTAVVLAAASVGVVLALRKEKQGQGGERTAIDRAFPLAGAVFLLASFFGPRDIPAWQCFSQRFVPLGIVLVLAALPIERLATRRGLVSTLTWLAAAVSLVVSFSFHRRLAAASGDAILGLSAKVERHRVWLPVTLEPVGTPLTPIGDAEVPMLAPLRHIGALYATVEGGLTPYTFASNPATWPFAIRRDAIHPPPVPPLEHYVSLLSTVDFQTNRAFRHEQEHELASYGMFYEGVLLTGATSDDTALWHKRGYVSDWEHGSVMVAHFEPCSADIVLGDHADEGDPPRLDVGVGTMVVLRDIEARRVTSGEGEARATRLVLDHAPCGRVWVKPHWSTPGGESEVCANSAEGGALASLLARGAPASPPLSCVGRRGAARR